MWTRFIRMVIFCILAGTIWVQKLDSELKWTLLDNGMQMRHVYSLEATGHRLYAGASFGIFISSDDGKTWLPTAIDKAILTLTVSGNTVYAGTWSQGVYRSDDAGVTWKPIRDGLRFKVDDNGRYYGDVRRILITNNNIISVMYHGGTYTSTDRGETWHDVSKEWPSGNGIFSMTEFGGYLWSAFSITGMHRSPDNGQTWGVIPRFERGRVYDWAALDGRLYVAGGEGIGRWNEATQMWEYPMNGLPTGSSVNPNNPPLVISFAIWNDRLFAGLNKHGVYAFDAPSETWSYMGLIGHSVSCLLFHRNTLYAGTENSGGIYRAVSPSVSVQAHGKAPTVWGRVKWNVLKQK